MRRLSAPLALIVISAYACTEPDPTNVMVEAAPQYEISDGTSGGNEHFFFLPPMAKSPTYSGTFDPTLSPVVAIKQGETTLGELEAALDEDNEQYRANWHTGAYNLATDEIYRLSIQVDGYELGFADIDMVENGAGLRDVRTDSYVGVVNGRTLPIPFRIEDGFRVPEWTSVSSVVTSRLLDVWGPAEDDVWAVGTGVFHFDGVAWEEIPGAGSGAVLFGIGGSGPDNVWAVGTSGAIWHYDGGGWDDVTPGLTDNILYGVWSDRPDNAWAVGLNGTILHYDGIGWSDVPHGLTTNQLFSVWGSGSDDVWVVGVSGTFLHYDGTGWSKVTVLGAPSLYDVWGSGPNDVWAVGLTFSGFIYHYDGVEWLDVTPDFQVEKLSGISGAGADRVWAVGVDGTVLEYDGVEWKDLELGLTTGLLQDVWASSKTNVWIVGDRPALGEPAALLHFGF